MYRHVPNREALLLTLYRRDVEALIDASPALLAEFAPVEAATRADLSSQYHYAPVAGAILSVLPGFLLQLALFGPDAVAGVPDAVRTLWPN